MLSTQIHVQTRIVLVINGINRRGYPRIGNVLGFSVIHIAADLFSLHSCLRHRALINMMMLTCPRNKIRTAIMWRHHRTCNTRICRSLTICTYTRGISIKSLSILLPLLVLETSLNRLDSC
ncbi:hypothetical protein ABFS82_04G209400 [Erythranthe guttata]